MGDSGLRRSRHIDEDQVAATAGCEHLVGDAKRCGASIARDLDAEIDVGVAPEAGPPRHLAGTREHVGVAPGGPEVAHAVLTESEADAELDDAGQRERLDAAGRNGGERDPLLGELLEKRLDSRIAVAEAERMRHGHRPWRPRARVRSTTKPSCQRPSVPRS